MKTPVKPSLRLLGESSRYKVLAQEAALRAITGERENRVSEECLAHDHLIRAETYAAAAKLIES
jgi:hypothetical protein